MSVPPGYLIYGELLYATHHLFYDKLPDYFLIFDIFSMKNGKWMPREQRDDFCSQHGFHQVPLIAIGYFDLMDLHELIPEQSAYGNTAEGIVIKRYRKKEYLRGKIVKPEFTKELEEEDHWNKGPLRKNLLRGD